MNPERLAERIAEIASDRKAIDIRVIDLRGLVSYTDFFVIATGNTERQTKAIHDAVHKLLKDEEGLLPRRVEGERESRWILMDYSDAVVHLFTPDARSFYRLEQLWGEAPVREVVYLANLFASGSSGALRGMCVAGPPLKTVELPREPASIAKARELARELEPAIGARHVFSAELLVSELVTNAVKYGGAGPLRVCVTHEPRTCLRVEVVDQGAGFAAQAAADARDRDDLEAVGGWGLPLVEHYADRWGSFEGSTHVWFEIDLVV